MIIPIFRKEDLLFNTFYFATEEQYELSTLSDRLYRALPVWNCKMDSIELQYITREVFATIPSFHLL